MFDYTNFDYVFGAQQFPYDRKTIQEIDTCRKSLDGALFIDRVLKALGLTKGTGFLLFVLSPPNGSKELTDARL
ncbi:hypothetical protein LY76DRAFT_596015 [Colletotrichum caudatum]|nr:hypothetical protein LY76DRAFT_596015 [Colletotrichum caudatum]